VQLERQYHLSAAIVTDWNVEKSHRSVHPAFHGFSWGGFVIVASRISDHNMLVT
jgi:hypothetical protein